MSGKGKKGKSAVWGGTAPVRLVSSIRMSSLLMGSIPSGEEEEDELEVDEGDMSDQQRLQCNGTAITATTAISA
jgi:hypothetical protein